MGQQCGMMKMNTRGSRGMLAGLADICARKGGKWEMPVGVCSSSNGDDVLFVAIARTPSERRCDRQHEDFIGEAYEPSNGLPQQAFTRLMHAQGFKPISVLRAERALQAQVADEERKRLALVAEQRRALQEQAESRAREAAHRERERLLAEAVQFRKTISVGSMSNCGPVVEIRQGLARIYAPVQGYGNEHWLEVDSLFPAGSGCRFVNGRYVAPL
jgi:hypothetical protein